MRPILLLLACLLAPAHIVAQAPRITPAGDPSVRSDSIYRLVVNPKEHPHETAVFLLDDGVIKVEADGRETRTFRQVVQILTADAVEDFAEQSFSWAPGYERFTLNWIRVVAPDGTIITREPSLMQESDVPASMDSPVYSNRKVLRVSLGGVAPGTIVDYSYTTEKIRPWLRGDFYQWWGVSTGLSVGRSRLIIDAPASLKLRIKENNLNFTRRTEVVGGRQVLTWATGDLQRLTPEPYAADSNGVYMSVGLASPLEWADVGNWYGGLAKGRYDLPSEVQERVKGLVRNARTARDTAAAIQRWVAQDIRYVSVALGLGGYQPRTPAEVVSTGFGDCKDKATLFVAALRYLGFDAAPVLTNASAVVERELPSLEQFDHAIAYVNLPEGRIYTDLTVALLPLGILPSYVQGEFGLAVHPDGGTEQVQFPIESVGESLTETRLVGRIGPEGRFNGLYEGRYSGARQASMRSAFESPMDSTERAKFTRQVAQRWFDGARGDSLVAFEGKDLEAEPKITLAIRDGRALRRSGDKWILANPLGSMSEMAGAADELESRPARLFPIDARRVINSETEVTELSLQLPEGWRPQLPKSVQAQSQFGKYETTYAFEGGVLRMVRRISGSRAVLPPEGIGELVAWFRQIAEDDAQYILIEPAPSP